MYHVKIMLKEGMRLIVINDYVDAVQLCQDLASVGWEVHLHRYDGEEIDFSE